MELLLYLSIKTLTTCCLPQVVASCKGVETLGYKCPLSLGSSPMFSLIVTSSKLPAIAASLRFLDMLMQLSCRLMGMKNRQFCRLLLFENLFGLSSICLSRPTEILKLIQTLRKASYYYVVMWANWVPKVAGSILKIRPTAFHENTSLMTDLRLDISSDHKEC